MAFKFLSANGWRKVGQALVGIIVAVALYNLVHGYSEFRNELTTMNNIHLNDSRAEVIYRLGSPPNVMGAPEPTVFDGKVVGHDRRLFYVHGERGDQINAMPAGRTVNDYDAWLYTPDPVSDLTIVFDRSGRVSEITCTAHSSDNPFACGPVAGIWNNDAEEKVLKLGKPSTNIIDGITKTIAYADLGAEFTLMKGRTYMLTLRRPTGGVLAAAKRYALSLLPSS